MDFNSADIGWPEETIIISYHGDRGLLLATVATLEATGYIFVVSPKHKAIAMSREAATAIGVWRAN